MRLENEDIFKSLHGIKLKSRERYIEARGIDVNKIKRIEEEITSSYNDLADKLKDKLKNAGEFEAKQLEVSLERRKRIDQKKLESLMEAKLTQAKFVPSSVIPIGPCFCWSYAHAMLVGNSGDTIINPPNGTGQATINWDVSKFMAHPRVDVSGQAGSTNSATAISQFKFAFTPAKDGNYCIKPIAQMNGHWLIWTWGSCSNENIGSGSVKVISRILVDQLSSNVGKFEKIVLNESRSKGDDEASGFYYDPVDTPSNVIYLEGGHEAVIKVECEVTAKMTDFGRAWVDMQTSPDFYFKVPSVSWGRQYCLIFNWPSLDQ